MVDPVKIVSAAEQSANQAVGAAKAEAATLWQKAVGLWNRFWPVAAGVAAGYVLGAVHALGKVF